MTEAPEFHYYDCGEIGGGWPHPASAHKDNKNNMDDTNKDPAYIQMLIEDFETKAIQIQLEIDYLKQKLQKMA